MDNKIMARIGAGLLITTAFTTNTLVAQPSEATQQEWQKKFMTTVNAGEKLFHSNEAGPSGISGNGVTCSQCHPGADNTHPETFPKYLPQLNRVATLRDMINWCIEHPLGGRPLAADDPKMIQLESYLTWQRRGVNIEPGKH